MFKDRLRASIKSSGLTIGELASKAGVEKRTIDNWTSSRPGSPIAEPLVCVSRVLGTTVEELILGEAGREHVVEWATRNIPQLRAPPGLEDLCDDLKKLDAASIEIVRATVKKIIEVRESGTTSEQKPQAKVS